MTTTTSTTTTTLQEAIAAARAGDMGRAQQLAAENVRANPDDANAWYLLSQLVESDARRAAYLSKTLALDPAHARARIEFDALPPALVAELAPTVELPTVELAAEPAVVETGAYATDELMAVAVATAAADAATPEPLAEPGLEAAAPEELPEWLQPLSPEPVGVATVAAEAPVAPEEIAAPPQPAAPRPRPAPVPKRNGGNQALTILLGLLAVLTVVVLGFLIYLLFA